MKLIIEIPIDLLERTKSGDYNFGDDLARNEVIVNGIPYNPSGDAISREALKDITYINKGNFNTVEGIREWIDNAPPVPQVTVFAENADEKAVEDLKAELQGVIGSRPQGEWKITEAYPHKVYCGACYKTYAQEDWEVWKNGSLPRNFCPKCGADMRKGDAE